MAQTAVDALLAELSSRSHPAIDVERAVWTKIARQDGDRASRFKFYDQAFRFQWPVSLAAIALAGSAGFLVSTLTPTASSVAPQSIVGWITPDAPLAPSTLLGG